MIDIYLEATAWLTLCKCGLIVSGLMLLFLVIETEISEKRFKK